MKRLTTQIPSAVCKTTSIDHLKHLQLADEHHLRPGSIDIILGADHYGQIIREKIIKSTDGKIVAQQTIFGWIVSGPACCSTCTSKKSQTAVRETSNEQLLEQLKRFWNQEESPSISSSSAESNLSPEDLECELHFQKTHTRDSTGRYIVRLPLKSSAADLGESKSTAIKFLKRLSRRLSTDPEYNQLYSAFMNEYEDMGHMKKVSDAPEPSPVYYHPHHGVLRADNITTKLRVVFNGSSKTSTGESLNDILHSGGKLQIDASDILIRLRKHRWIFGTDIVKMFRQIRVHEADWDLQRIVWLDKNEKIVSYQLTTVTYGQTSAPWLSLRVLEQLAKDEGHRYPLALNAIRKKRYVDDIYDGADTEEELIKIIHQLIGLCSAGGFPLQKWSSNSEKILHQLGVRPSSSSTIELADPTVKVLGLCLHLHSDTYRYKSRRIVSSIYTKRSVLSEIARLFDPIGLIAPLIIRAKTFIQELWLLKGGWDDPLPLSYAKRWKSFTDELNHLDVIAIPRWLKTYSNSTVQIHGFADASNLAMAAAVYLRVEDSSNNTGITLITAKTKVAPIKRMVIARLELSAALLLTELVIYVKRTLELENPEIHLWTDSAVTLHWIHGHPSRWKDFVHNRVVKIQDSLSSAQWRHINGKENPADCASRGLSVTELAEHQLWWNGPAWLKSPP